jgi:hypothetical protein
MKMSFFTSDTPAGTPLDLADDMNLAIQNKKRRLGSQPAR